MEKKEDAVIYGIVDGETIHYIGKTKHVKEDGTIIRHEMSYIYNNPQIRDLVVDNFEIKLVPIEKVLAEEWYDEKLAQVVEKHRQNHPLLNAQWMKEGKRGYWEGTDGFWKGKERDANTLFQLHTSKYKKVLQYNVDGFLQKIWAGGKEAGVHVFGDYKVVNGAGDTKLYTLLNNKRVKNRLAHGSYWFRFEEILDRYGKVPLKIDPTQLGDEWERENRLTWKKPVQTHRRNYTVEWYEGDKLVEKFDNIFHAAYHFRTSPVTIRRVCKGIISNSYYDLRYGKKELQPINISETYPRYKAKPIKRKKVVKPKKERQRTRTHYTVAEHRGKEILRTFNSVEEAAEFYDVPVSSIRNQCSRRVWVKKLPDLRYGPKSTVIYSELK